MKTNVDKNLTHHRVQAMSSGEKEPIGDPRPEASCQSHTQQERIAETRIVRLSETWIDSVAIDQLKKTAELPGIRLAVGLPDLHPGRGRPIGAIFASAGLFYPELVGSDIGCGMGFWQTSLNPRDVRSGKWERKLKPLDSIWDGDAAAWLATHGGKSSGFERALGTIGGGNHFAELQKVEEIIDQKRFDCLSVNPNRLYLLIHSGSRGLGQAILDTFMCSGGRKGTTSEEQAGREYLAGHEQALAWAKANRALIAERFLYQLGASYQFVLDIPHNFLERVELRGEQVWLHRKGAVPSNRGLVMIPGSRGTLSYLVEPVGDCDTSGMSLAHGAGRKWPRSSCREHLEGYLVAKDLTITDLGGHVICADRDLLFEEAPQAYKDISKVIDALVAHGLIRVIATFRPVLTYKSNTVCSTDPTS